MIYNSVPKVMECIDIYVRVFGLPILMMSFLLGIERLVRMR